MSADPSTLPQHVDLAIIGAGPAGATLAALVADKGWSVALLEKDHHPRFHIGESLLPQNMKIFRELGVLDEVRQIGVRKCGVDFTADLQDAEHTEIRFAEALNVEADTGEAVQVLRSEFDQLLARRAVAAGAELHQGTRVDQVDLSDPALTRLTLRRDAEQQSLTARFVVDASGRDTLLARRMGLLERNRQHATAALYGHFRNVPRRPGDAAGNISIYWFDQGWIWMIPLPDGVFSVGVVCNPGYLKSAIYKGQALFQQTLARNPRAAERMREATAISDITTTGNYSYRATRIDGPNWLLIGDAAMFLDPVFSSGVFFGMDSAVSAAELLDAELANDHSRARACRKRFRARVRRGIDELAWFVYRFPTPAMRQLFLQPRNILGMKQAVISVLAGDVHDSLRVRWRLRLFRVVYALNSLRNRGANRRCRQQGLRNTEVELHLER